MKWPPAPSISCWCRTGTMPCRPSCTMSRSTPGWTFICSTSRCLLKVSPVAVKNEAGRLIARWDFQGDGRPADLIASYGDAGNWRGRYWHTLKAEIEGQTCQAELPAGTLPCYVSGAVVDKNGIRCSTPLVRVDSAALGVKASVPVPDYDGCAEWGGFEEDSDCVPDAPRPLGPNALDSARESRRQAGPAVGHPEPGHDRAGSDPLDGHGPPSIHVLPEGRQTRRSHRATGRRARRRCKSRPNGRKSAWI